MGANFILLGSTKVIAIVSIYHDLALGVPTRLLGNVLSLADRSRLVPFPGRAALPALRVKGTRYPERGARGGAWSVCGGSRTGLVDELGTVKGRDWAE